MLILNRWYKNDDKIQSFARRIQEFSYKENAVIVIDLLVYNFSCCEVK